MFAEITSEQKKKGVKQKKKGTKRKRSSNVVGDGPIISFLNGAWVSEKYPLKDSFLQLLEKLYKARVRNIDCKVVRSFLPSSFIPKMRNPRIKGPHNLPSSLIILVECYKLYVHLYWPEMVVQEINEWANASTKGLIKEVIREDHITTNTLLILANALYFKGSWKKGFHKHKNMDEWFYLLNNEKIKVTFMTDCEDYSHEFFEDFQVARIPYKKGRDSMRKFAMYIFLPYEKDGLQSLLESVNSNPEFFIQHCDFPRGGIVDIFRIPKFKFNYVTEEGPDIMKGMGLTLPFDDKKAQFREMIEDDHLMEDERVYVSNIIQKTFIEVNEEGTKACAMTLARMATAGAAPGRSKTEPTKFIAEHPFMFIIREEKSGVVFFAGTVLNPLEED